MEDVGKVVQQHLNAGAGGGIRTHTRRTSGDFESPASPSSATPAESLHRKQR